MEPLQVIRKPMYSRSINPRGNDYEMAWKWTSPSVPKKHHHNQYPKWSKRKVVHELDVTLIASPVVMLICFTVRSEIVLNRSL